MLVLAALLLTLSLGLIVSTVSGVVSRSNDIAAVEDIVRDAVSLRMVAFETVLYHQTRSYGQWQSKLEAMTGKLELLAENSPDRAEKITRMLKKLALAKSVYSRLSPLPSTEKWANKNANPIETTSLEARTVSSLFIILEEVTDEGYELIHVNREKSSTALQYMQWSSALVMFMLGGFFLLVWRNMARSVLRPLLDFEHATQRIAAGDYAFRLAFKQKNEIGALAISFDEMTERVQRTQASLREKNAEIVHFTYMISHDLKSPLVTIRTFLSYLQEDMKSANAERVGTDIAYIANAAEKMNHMLEDLLEFSRVGQVNKPAVVLNWRELVDEALTLVAGGIAQKGVKIEISEEILQLKADRSNLVQIWQNLIDNAVKFSASGKAPVIRIGSRGKGNDREFFVCDNGAGIDPRYHDKIFDLFEKLDVSVPGSGLGLALVRRIVEQYGGSIKVESKGLGSGSCFRFTLPDAIE